MAWPNFRLSAVPHVRRDEALHIAAQPRYLLDNARTEKSVSFSRHHKNRFHGPVQFTIHQSELKFKFKVRNGAQSADDSLAILLGGVIDQQTVERIRVHIGELAQRLFNQAQTILEREEWLFALVLGHGHDDAVKQLGRALNDVQMAVGQRVEAAGINCRSHNQ